MRGWCVLVAGIGLSLAGLARSEAATTVEMTITFGGKARTVVIELDEATAPQTTANFKKLCSEGFYNGVAFHRVIPNYIAQAGDPLSKDTTQKARWGTGGPGYKVPAELGGKHVRGAIAAARLSDKVNPGKASSGSQFYVCLREISTLDGEYTVFGRVTMGLDHFDEIATAPADADNSPLDRIEIISTKVTESAPAGGVPPMPNLTGTTAEPPGATATAAAPTAANGATNLGAAVDRGIPPMPDLSAASSNPGVPAAPVSAATPTAGATPALDRGLPPMPDLGAAAAATPSNVALPEAVAPAPDRGLPPMPDLSQPLATNASGFGPESGVASGGTELPVAGVPPGEPLPPGGTFPQGDPQPAPPTKPEKPPGFFGKLIRKFW